MRDSSIRLGLLFVVLLPTLACDKLLHKDVDGGVDAAGVDAGAIVDAAAPATDDDAGPAPTLDAGPTTAVHTGPAGLVGTFEGAVKEGNVHFGLTAVLADKGGTVTYTAPFDCKGTWTLVSHSAKTWTYKEHITMQTGKRKCADGETATIVETAPSVYSFTNPHATATLSKTK